MTTPRVKLPRRPVHGVLLLDKPLGWSSNQALQKVKWLLRAEKAGHTGTLDPLATGVLPLCFGAATKWSQLQLEADKTYEATLQLGATTTTGDAEGEVLQRREVQVTPEQWQNVCQRFTGQIQQTPPMYSALKQDGKPLYEYARQGVEVERAARTVTIHAMQTVQSDWSRGVFVIHATVSKGTYIRSLAQDMGEALGCGAHLIGLRRLQTGGFKVEQCVTVTQIEAMQESQRLACLQPVSSLLQGYQAVTLDSENAARFLSGLRRRGAWADASQVAVYAEQARVLLGTAHIKAGELIPTRLLNPLEIQQMEAL